MVYEGPVGFLVDDDVEERGGLRPRGDATGVTPCEFGNALVDRRHDRAGPLHKVAKRPRKGWNGVPRWKSALEPHLAATRSSSSPTGAVNRVFIDAAAK